MVRSSVAFAYCSAGYSNSRDECRVRMASYGTEVRIVAWKADGCVGLESQWGVGGHIRLCTCEGFHGSFFQLGAACLPFSTKTYRIHASPTLRARAAC